ncbi:MAG: hypothetical protein ABIQ02_07290 [Saprospiraceae bacterium]
MLVLLSIGLTRTQAQNYKPFDEAVASVTNALEALRVGGSVKSVVPKTTNGNGQSTTSSLPPSQTNDAQLKTFEISYFELFLLKAKLVQDIAQGVIDLDATVNAQGQSAARTSNYTTGRANLMALITN